MRLSTLLASLTAFSLTVVGQQTSGIQDTSIISEATPTSTAPSVAAATTTTAPVSSAEPSPIYNYDTSSDVDTDAGASGSQGNASFSLSKGGLIAIIVVVVIVVIIGGTFPPPSSVMITQKLNSQNPGELLTGKISCFHSPLHPGQTPSMESSTIDQTRFASLYWSRPATK